MVNSRNIAALGLVFTAMAGCSMSDHPIPPLDVGSSGSIASLNEQDGGSDYARAETSPQRQAAYPGEDLPVSRMRLPPAPVGSGGSNRSFRSADNGRDVAYADTNDRSYDERNRGGARTLDAQAAQLDPPSAPVREPLAPVRATAPLEPARDIAAVPSGPARIALAEVSGVGVNAAQPLATRFGKQAREHGLAFTAASDTTATHVMKGYFTVGEENGRAVVNYVWDINDRSGKRLHRIQGSEPGGGEGVGWDGVTPEAMQAIADHSIEETARFVGAQNG
ncbi:hypothetical protein JYU29_10255 [Tianweitania sp. BSSL-BM11]|uniref:Lipoprotein n=1 Tax=Tianweitania aestuarii TaxID=2814886 RepID=A0ABS5RXM9_9HYPH|nr:hypothetical protein [Tianweitania aestuarii]MBS9721067.1 hypothetical protein [Tianweitania aestuarii]